MRTVNDFKKGDRVRVTRDKGLDTRYTPAARDKRALFSREMIGTVFDVDEVDECIGVFAENNAQTYFEPSEVQHVEHGKTIEEKLALLRSLRVILHDDKACEAITPEMARRYLTSHGWTLVEEAPGYLVYDKEESFFNDYVWLPTDRKHDYGRRIVSAINTISQADQCSALAVYLDMLDCA